MHLRSWPKFCIAGEKHGRRGTVTAELSGQSPAARLRSCDSMPRALGSQGEGQGQVKTRKIHLATMGRVAEGR